MKQTFVRTSFVGVVLILFVINSSNAGLLEDNKNLTKVEIALKCYKSKNGVTFCISPQRQLIEKVVKNKKLFEYGNTNG